MESGTEAHSIVDNTPAANGLEARRRLLQRFNPASAQVNLNLMSRILKPPQGRVDNISFTFEQWNAMVDRQDQRTGRESMTEDTEIAIMMDMSPAELERHVLLISVRYDTYPNAAAFLGSPCDH